MGIGDTKKALIIVAVFLAAILYSEPSAEAALWLSDTFATTENFDGMGTGSTTPTDWRMDSDPTNYRTVGTWAAAQSTLLAIPPDPTDATPAGIKNWWCGTDNASAPSRSPGWISSAANTRSGNLYAQFANRSGDTLTGMTISYDTLKFRNGDQVDGWTIQLYYSKNGTAWTNAGADFATLWANDGNTTGYGTCPAETKSVTDKQLNVSLANGDTLYLCWLYSPTTASASSNGMGLGVDNFSIRGIRTAPAQIIFNEVSSATSSDWIEFYVVQGGTLLDTISKSSGESVPVGSGQVVAAGDYIVLWFWAGTSDTVKSDSNAGFWDLFWSGPGGPTATDETYRLYMSGSTTIKDFIGYADQSVALNSDDKDALTQAYAAGQWDTFGVVPDAMDFVRSYSSGVFVRDQASTDTNSRYGWESRSGAGTPGSANPVFQNKQGEGRWAVSPSGTVVPSSSGTWEFRFQRGTTATLDGYLTFTAPTGWSKPQQTNAGAAGYTRVFGDINDIMSGTDSCPVEDSTIIIAVNTLAAGESVTIVYGYGGGAAAAVAPAGAGSYTFTMMSDPLGSNVRALDSSPVLVVGTPMSVYLKDVASCTIGPDSSNVTLLAGRIVGEAAGDTLLGLTVTNLGTATTGDTRDSGNQGGLSLWLDVDGDSVWDTGDSWVATLNSRGAALWGFSASTVLMPAGVFNFIVTANISATPVDGHNFQLQIGTNRVATTMCGSGPASDTTNSGTQTISVPLVYTPYTPFVWSLTLDSHSVAKLLAEQTYSCTVVFTDSNGYTEIDSGVVLINSATAFAAGDSCAYFKFADSNSHFFIWNDTTQAWLDCGDTTAFTAKENNYVTLVGGTVSRSGNNLTVGWVFRPKFGWEDESCNAYAQVTDSSPSSPGWQNKASATTENDLTFMGVPAVTSGYHGALTSYGVKWVRTGETLAWSGLTVVYQGTTVSPNDTYFNIRITDTDATTDTIDVTGALDTLTVAGSDAGPDTYRFTIINRPSGGADVADTWFTLLIDPVAPATLVLASPSAGADTVRLTWTALTSDGLSPFVRYEVYWDTVSPVTLADSLWSATEHSLLGAIGADSTIITGLLSSATYYFAIRGVDTAGNVGVLSGEISKTTNDELRRFTVTAPATANLDDTFSITITAINRIGGTYTGFADTAYLRVDTGAIYPTAATGFAAGVKTLDVQMDTLGANVIHASAGLPGAIFFSEYYVGSVNSKYFEIFNGTGTTLNLDGYMVREFNSNGTVYFLPLTGSVAANDVFVVCHSSAAANILAASDLDSSTTVMQFNGDDGLALMNSAGDTLDVMGDSRVVSWGAAMTLVRKSTVNIGDRERNDVFDRTVEWTQYAQNDSTYLGFHTWASTSGAATGTAAITIVAIPKPEVLLKNVASETLYADSTNATLLAGRVVGESGGDTLLAFTVRNLGTATAGDTKDSGNQGGLNLWRDVNGDSQWDAGDSWVATLNVSAAGYWGRSFSTVLMPGGVFNFVVTANISSTPVDGHTFRLRVGMDSVTTDVRGLGPAADTTNSGTQTISVPAVPVNPGDVLITEIFWDGNGGAAGLEWFELHNMTANVVSLSGWTVTDGEDIHTFGAVSIPAFGYFLCEASENATTVAADDIYGDDAGTLALLDGGDQLTLARADATTIDAVDFAGGWPGSASGGLGTAPQADGISMERRDLDTSWASAQLTNWLSGPYTVACGALGGVSGTPRAVNSMAAYANLKINEVNFNDWDKDEWVEIYNAGDTPINIYNWVVTNHDGNNALLPQVAIPRRGFLVVHSDNGTTGSAFAGTNSVLHQYANITNWLVDASPEGVGLYTCTAFDQYCIIDFVAYEITPGDVLDDADTAVTAGIWPNNTTQVDIANVEGRSMYRTTDGADADVTGDWAQLGTTMVNFFSEGGTNESNKAATLTAVTGCTVLWTTSDATGYLGAVGDSALIRLTGSDGDATGTDVTNCTVISSATDGSGNVVLKLTETGLNTGIFEGWLNLRISSSDANWWIGCGIGQYVTIRSVEDPSRYDTIVIGESVNPGVNSLIINEYLANSGGTSDTEFIEIYNPTDTPIRIAGCYVDDDAGGASPAYQIPNTGTAADTIAAHGLKVYYGSVTGISLSNASDDVRLLASDNSLIGIRSYGSSSYNVSSGCCHDGSNICWMFDGVDDPGPTPGATNNPAPLITRVYLVSNQTGANFTWNGVQDTSVPGGGNATTAFFKSALAHTLSIGVYGLYTYDSTTCTGTVAFADGVQYAAQATTPCTLTYTAEVSAGAESVTVTLTDTCGAGDSLTISFVPNDALPMAPTGLTAVADTALPDTGVRLAWNSVTGDTAGYYVYVDTDGNGFAQRISGLLTDTTGFLVDSRIVTLGETYVFYVTCTGPVGESLHSDTAVAPIMLPYKYRDTVSLGGVLSPALPGATVAWRIGVHNNGFGPADTVTVIDHVRPGTTYKVNSADTVAARGYRATIQYSNDTGATWGSSQALAPRVTSIRWTIPPRFYTGSIIEVKFEATID